MLTVFVTFILFVLVIVAFDYTIAKFFDMFK